VRISRLNLSNYYYFDSYHFASVVDESLDLSSQSSLSWMSDFFIDDNYVEFLGSFNKFTLFHRYIGFIVDSIFADTDINDETFEAITDQKYRDTGAPEVLTWIERAFRRFGMKHESFSDYLLERGSGEGDAGVDLISEYYSDLHLCGPKEELINKISDEVFYIIFRNRRVLFNFNEIVALHVARLSLEDIEPEFRAWFSSEGRLKRLKPPEWAKRAVFYRDRGRCTRCNKDLSGLINITSDKNYDHIVPIARGGVNDVTNLQLLCEDCNLKKGDEFDGTSTVYERWF